MSKKNDHVESTALTVIPAGDFTALAQEAQELRELVDEFFADGLNEGDLHTVKIPGAGGKNWDLPGDESARSFIGVVLGIQNTRTYYPEAFSGTGQPPVCNSRDGVTGQGLPGGICSVCPHAHWGSGKNGVGTACGERKILYVLRPEDVLPIRLALPATSFRNLRRYNLALLNKRMRVSGVATEFGLTQVQSKSGITYSQATFAVAGTLNPETAARAKAYAMLLAASLSGKPIQEDMTETAARRPDLNEDDVPFDWNEGPSAKQTA